MQIVRMILVGACWPASPVDSQRWRGPTGLRGARCDRTGGSRSEQRRREDQAQLSGHAAPSRPGVPLGEGRSDGDFRRAHFRRPDDGDQPPADFAGPRPVLDQLDPQGERPDHHTGRQDAQSRLIDQRQAGDRPGTNRTRPERRDAQRQRHHLRDSRQSRDCLGAEKRTSRLWCRPTPASKPTKTATR